MSNKQRYIAGVAKCPYQQRYIAGVAKCPYKQRYIAGVAKCPYKQRYIAGVAKFSTKLFLNFLLLFLQLSKPVSRNIMMLAFLLVALIKCGY